MKKRVICIATPVLLLLAANLASAATIPAGTTLVVRTLQTIASVDAPGTRFPVQLENNLVVNGKVALAAGAKLTGKVVTSRRTYSSTQRLTVDITEAIVGGRTIVVRTTGAAQLDNNRFKTRNDVSVSRAGYAVPAGRVIQFHLAQPLQF
jgi:hypothetical protein